MDPKIRGIVEKNIDHHLLPKELENMFNICKHYKTLGFLRDIESAMFASIVAHARNSHGQMLYFTGQYEDADFDAEAKEFETIILSKGAYILSKIREAANK